MVRLYVDMNLVANEEIVLSTSEKHYMRSVRRERGVVEVFNRSGQVASAEVLQSGALRILEVWKSTVPLHDVTFHIALPDRNILSNLIGSLSEMGARKLIFFRGDRSQSASKRLRSMQKEIRWEKLGIEAMRQCARPEPLVIQFDDEDLSSIAFENENSIIFFDEVGKGIADSSDVKVNGIHLIVGTEGGWSDREREIARSRPWRITHFPTPILRVETAAVAAATWALSRV